MKHRTTAFVAIVVLFATAALSITVAHAAPAPAGPVRYEAEDARIAMGAVESNHAGFSGRGFVNYDGKGSYVEWTVNTPYAGRAQIHIRYANGSRDVRVGALTLNGQPSDVLHFGPTGSWSTWQNYAYTPLLKAGANRIRLTATTSRGGPNVDWLESELEYRAFDFQAEDAVVSRGRVESEHRGYTGRGYVNPDRVAGGYVEWTVAAPTDGFFNVSWIFANATTQDRTTTLSVNGVVVSDEWLFRSVSGSWTTWEEAGLTIPMRAGPNTIRLTANTADGGPNYDRLILFIWVKN